MPDSTPFIKLLRQSSKLYNDLAEAAKKRTQNEMDAKYAAQRQARAAISRNRRNSRR